MDTQEPQTPNYREAAATLRSTEASPREVVDAENQRVDQLLNEDYTNPYTQELKIVTMGRKVLAKAGLATLEKPQPIERPWLEEAQQVHTEQIKETLDASREMLKKSFVPGFDDRVVDVYLGLRSDKVTPIVPPHFVRLHKEAEEQEGKEISFLQWMTDHTTDEQLLNVWQWHDSYLRNLDEDPQFKERVAKTKEDYFRGNDEAVINGELYPNARVNPAELQKTSIRHGSPLVPLTLTSQASFDRVANEISIRPDTSDQALFHEITHATEEGFIHQLGEGVTELKAATIYNAVHPNEPYDIEKSAYKDQVNILAALKFLTGGKLDTRELSRLSVRGSSGENTTALLNIVDSALGLPVFSCMIASALEAPGTHNAADPRKILEMENGNPLAKNVALLKDVHTDENGKRIFFDDPYELLRRLTDSAIISRHDNATFRSVALSICEGIQLNSTRNKNT